MSTKPVSLGLDGRTFVKASTLADTVTADDDGSEQAPAREGESFEGTSPDGTVPYAPGESANALTGRGDDVETQMQATEFAMVMPATESAMAMPATQLHLEEAEMDVDRSELLFPQERNGIGQRKKFDIRDPVQ